MFLTKELSLWNKLKYLNLNIFRSRCCKHLIFQTQIIWSNKIHSLKYLKSATSGSKDIVIKKSEFVAKTQFLFVQKKTNVFEKVYLTNHSFWEKTKFFFGKNSNVFSYLFYFSEWSILFVNCWVFFSWTTTFSTKNFVCSQKCCSFKKNVKFTTVPFKLIKDVEVILIKIYRYTCDWWTIELQDIFNIYFLEVAEDDT